MAIYQCFPVSGVVVSPDVRACMRAEAPGALPPSIDHGTHWWDLLNKICTKFQWSMFGIKGHISTRGSSIGSVKYKHNQFAALNACMPQTVGSFLVPHINRSRYLQILRCLASIPWRNQNKHWEHMCWTEQQFVSMRATGVCCTTCRTAQYLDCHLDAITSLGSWYLVTTELRAPAETSAAARRRATPHTTIETNAHGNLDEMPDSEF